MSKTLEEELLKMKLKSEQTAKSYMRRERDKYRKLYQEVREQNILLQAKVDDETNREWSPVWLRARLVEVQAENERLKKYIMALEEKRDYKGVTF